MKRVLSVLFTLCFAVSLHAQGWFDSNDFGVGLYSYGQVELYGPVTATDTLIQIDRQTILVEADSEHVFAYREDADDEADPMNVASPQMSDYELSSAINNFYSFEPPDLVVKINIYGWDDGGYGVFKYTVINIADAALDARIGLEIIPEIAGEYGFETVEYLPEQSVFTMHKTDNYIGYKYLSHPLASMNTIVWYSGYDSTDANLSAFLNHGEIDTLFESQDADGTVVFPSTDQITVAAGDSVEFYMAAAFAADQSTLLDNIAMAETKYQGMATATEPENALPAVYNLSQNYPNPFNPETQITFNLPQQSFVTLTVYNSLGQAVETLVQKEMTSGAHSVKFQGSDLPSGIYFYSIKADNYQATRKMLLVK